MVTGTVWLTQARDKVEVGFTSHGPGTGTWRRPVLRAANACSEQMVRLLMKEQEVQLTTNASC